MGNIQKWDPSMLGRLSFCSLVSQFSEKGLFHFDSSPAEGPRCIGRNFKQSSEWMSNWLLEKELMMYNAFKGPSS